MPPISPTDTPGSRPETIKLLITAPLITSQGTSLQQLIEQLTATHQLHQLSIDHDLVTGNITVTGNAAHIHTLLSSIRSSGSGSLLAQIDFATQEQQPVSNAQPAPELRTIEKHSPLTTAKASAEQQTSVQTHSSGSSQLDSISFGMSNTKMLGSPITVTWSNEQIIGDEGHFLSIDADTSNFYDNSAIDTVATTVNTSSSLNAASSVNAASLLNALPPTRPTTDSITQLTFLSVQPSTPAVATIPLPSAIENPATATVLLPVMTLPIIKGTLSSFVATAVTPPSASPASAPMALPLSLPVFNNAPVAMNDTYHFTKGATTTITSLNGVLKNDTDAENNPLTVSLVQNVTHGTLTLNTNGSFSYRHDDSTTLTDSFTYRINDGTQNGNVATVTLADTHQLSALNWNIASPATTQYNNLQLWLDSNDISTVTLNGNQVTGLADKSTAVQINNASAVALNNAPAYNYSSTGLKTLQLDGVDDYLRVLDADNLDNTNQLTIIAMVTPTLLDGAPRGIISKRVTFDTQDSYNSFFFTGGKLATDVVNFNDRFLSNTAFNVNNDYTIVTTFNGANASAQRVKIDVNGTFDTFGNETSTAMANNASNLYLGVLNSAVVTFQGNIHEIMVFNTDLGTADRQAIERYLATKYGHTIDGAVPNTNPTAIGSSTVLDKLDVSGTALQMTLKDTSSIKGVEYISLRGNNNAHAVSVQDSYYNTTYLDTVVLDATSNTQGVIFSGTLLTNAAHRLDLRGSDSRDALAGGAGNDAITGGDGADTLTGGTGNDIFIYNAQSNSGIGSGNRDVITDFSLANDKIDLSALYSAGLFTFRGGGGGSGNFTGTVPQLAYQQTGGNTIISLDTDGNSTTDMQIELTGLFALTATQFIL